MKVVYIFCAGVLSLLLAHTAVTQTTTPLDLTGYADANGAISVIYAGDSVDPYFAMQALLLGQENGLDVSESAEKFVNWLVPYQKPDGTFNRFCRTPTKTWVSCQAADADDSLLAIWMKLLETMPLRLKSNPVWSKSYSVAKVSLEHLYQPSRGIYMVSPVYLHGLFMDNLEVWSLKVHLKQPGQRAEADQLAKTIQGTFWDPVNKRFIVSTQLEQKAQKPAFYPDHVGQIFPLLVGFSPLPAEASSYYRDWMRAHRAEWLSQGKADYPWGLLAVLALRQNDSDSAACWLRESTPLRHGPRWAVSDEVSYQILVAKGVKSASAVGSCG